MVKNHPAESSSCRPFCCHSDRLDQWWIKCKYPIVPTLAKAQQTQIDPLGPFLTVAWPLLRLSTRGKTLILPSLSMLPALLTPVAVLAGTLGVWRLAADPEWTNQFFIRRGLLSHWQIWFIVASGVHASSHGLKKWLHVRDPKANSSAGQSRGTTRRGENDGFFNG